MKVSHHAGGRLLALISLVLANGCTTAPPYPSSKSRYDYAAVCDFALARLSELESKASSGPMSYVTRVRSAPDGAAIYRYQDQYMGADFARLKDGRVIVISGTFNAWSITPNDRDRESLLRRLGIADSGERVSATCDATDIHLNFDGARLKSVELVAPPIQ